MKKLAPIIFSIVSVVFGVIFIFSGIKTIADKDLYDTQITATVVEVTEEWQEASDPDGPDELVKTAYIDYEVDGKKYEHILSPVQDDNLKVGDTVDILCQSKDPSAVSSLNPAKGGTIFIVLGALVAIAGIISAIRFFVRRR